MTLYEFACPECDLVTERRAVALDPIYCEACGAQLACVCVTRDVEVAK